MGAGHSGACSVTSMRPATCSACAHTPAAGADLFVLLGDDIELLSKVRGAPSAIPEHATPGNASPAAAITRVRTRPHVPPCEQGWKQEIEGRFVALAEERGLPLGCACVAFRDLAFPVFPTFPVMHKWHLAVSRLRGLAAVACRAAPRAASSHSSSPHVPVHVHALAGVWLAVPARAGEPARRPLPV